MVVVMNFHLMVLIQQQQKRLKIAQIIQIIMKILQRIQLGEKLQMQPLN